MLQGKVIIVLSSLAGASAVGYGLYEVLKPKALSDYLSSSEKPLNSEEDKEEDNDKWKELVKKYEECNESSPKPIEDFSLSKSNSENYSENIKKLKGQCKKLLSSSSRDLTKEEMDKKMSQIRNWCLQNSQGESKQL